MKAPEGFKEHIKDMQKCDNCSELEAENEQLLKRIEHLALEVRGLLDEIEKRDEYIEELRFNQPL